MSNNVTGKPATELEPPPSRPPRRTAYRDRNWEVLVVSFVFLLSIVATVGMVLISVSQDVLRIIPAAALLVMVELWLTLTLPFYSKLSFWGALIFLMTFLFFAVPGVALNLLPDVWGIITWVSILVFLICFVLLFRQRDLYLGRPTAPRKAAGNARK